MTKINKGDIVHIDPNSFFGKRYHANAIRDNILYRVTDITKCSNKPANYKETSCYKCKNQYVSLQQMNGSRTINRKCFGYSSRRHGEEYVLIKNNATIFSDFAHWCSTTKVSNIQQPINTLELK